MPVKMMQAVVRQRAKRRSKGRKLEILEPSYERSKIVKAELQGDKRRRKRRKRKRSRSKSQSPGSTPGIATRNL